MDTGTQIAAAAIISFFVNFLKGSKFFPGITAETGKLNRVLAILLSGMAAIGIHARYSSTDHTLLFTGLSLTTVLYGLWHWIVQALYVHGWYKATSSNDQAAAK